MIRSYLLLMLRRLRREKTYAVINLAGLTISLAASLFIFLYVRYEYSFEDYHHFSMREAIQPTLFYGADENLKRFLMVRYAPGEEKNIIARVKEVWSRMEPDVPFEYQFLDDRYNALYQNDIRFSKIVGAFTILVILIACFGIFGLANYTAERRIKEMSIRKVLGATASSIVVLFSREYVFLLLVAFVLSVPVAFIATSRWTESFVYRIQIGPGIFLLALLFTAILALAAISLQVLRIAKTDPARTLRYE